jgi:hypothetical protein
VLVVTGTVNDPEDVGGDCCDSEVPHRCWTRCEVDVTSEGLLPGSGAVSPTEQDELALYEKRSENAMTAPAHGQSYGRVVLTHLHLVRGRSKDVLSGEFR